MRKLLCSIPVFLLVASSCGNDNSGVEFTECTGGTFFCKYTDFVVYPHDYFSLPGYKMLRIYDDMLIEASPHQPDSLIFEAESRIFPESKQITPDGGMFFMCFSDLYYRDPNGIVTSSDMDALYGGFIYEDNWDGTSYLTPEGNYVYVDRDGDGYTFTGRTRYFVKIINEHIDNIPYGDCLAAFNEGDIYTLLIHFTFQGVPYDKLYRWNSSTNTIQNLNIQIPEETLFTYWRNFKNNGDGTASFEIYTDETIRSYTLNLSGGPYAFNGERSRKRIEAPDGYYTYETVEYGPNDPIRKFRVNKYSPNDVFLWSSEIRAGWSGLTHTFGWADSTGVFFLSHCEDPYSNQDRTNQLYISKDGKYCY